MSKASRKVVDDLAHLLKDVASKEIKFLLNFLKNSLNFLFKGQNTRLIITRNTKSL